MLSESEFPYLSRPDLESAVKEFNTEELTALCVEIRRFLIKSTSASGGHLASNLGAVELSVALEYCFDTRKDRLVFDVGHQCYTHKLLTGRASGFEKLRAKGGVSGFPRPAESSADVFVAGHGSNSVSALTGLLRADQLFSREERAHVCLIGDGAMTGGMVYEAMDDAGASKLPMIVVLNDNGMSIGKNVGAVSRMLTRMRVNPDYLRAKQHYHSIMQNLSPTGALDAMLKKIKNTIKYTLIPESFFEGLGFRYIGPVDGHDISELITVFSALKNTDRPVLVHAVTKKGMGWQVTEQRPERFHSVGSFSPETGEMPASLRPSLSRVFGQKLCELAAGDKRIVAVSAAMRNGTGLDAFAEAFGDRFFDVGIAEEHAVTMSAGLAAGGMKPFCAIYATFLQRTFDQIFHDVGIMSLPVTFCIDRAGFVAGDGETHQGLYDVALLSAIPGMRIYMPANCAELRSALQLAAEDRSGPMAIRYPRGSGSAWKGNTFASPATVLKKGDDLTLVTAGRLIDSVLEAGEMLESAGVSARVLKLNCILPLPAGFIAENSVGPVIVCDELCAAGSPGMALAAVLKGHRVYPLNAGNRYYAHDTVEGLMAEAGLDKDSLYAFALKVYSQNEQ